MRVRPFNSWESGQDLIINTDSNKLKIKDPAGGEEKEFKFDRCIWSHDDTHGGLKTNQHVYDDLGVTLLNNAFNGYNATIFAYG